VKSRLAIIILAFCAFTGANLYASDILTLAKASELALARSKTLQQALLSVDSSLIAEKAQGYETLPQASLSLGGGLSYPTSSGATVADSTSLSASLSLSQTIYDGGKNAVLAAIDKLATKSAREEARAAYLDVIESTEKAYYAVLEAQAGMEAAESDLVAAKAHQSIAQAKFDAGMVIKAAVIEAQAETAAKETSLSQATKTLAVAKAKLKSITGVGAQPQAVDFLAYGTLMTTLMTQGDQATDSMIAKLNATALSNNPAIAVSTIAVAQAESEIAAARTAYLPTVSAAWSHEASYTAVGGVDLASGGGFSITVSVPLDFCATKNAVEAKGVEAQKAALSKDIGVDNLSLEIQSAAYDLISAARSVSSSQKALEYAESSYSVELERYKLSKASSSELSDAEALVSSSRSALISARYAFLSGISTLKNLAGLDGDSLLLALSR